MIGFYKERGFWCIANKIFFFLNIKPSFQSMKFNLKSPNFFYSARHFKVSMNYGECSLVSIKGTSTIMWDIYYHFIPPPPTQPCEFGWDFSYTPPSSNKTTWDFKLFQIIIIVQQIRFGQKNVTDHFNIEQIKIKQQRRRYRFKEVTNASSLNWLRQNRMQNLYCSMKGRRLGAGGIDKRVPIYSKILFVRNIGLHENHG